MELHNERQWRYIERKKQVEEEKDLKILELAREVKFLKSKIDILEKQLERKIEEDIKEQEMNKTGYFPYVFTTRLNTNPGLIDERDLKEIYTKQYNEMAKLLT